MGTKGRMVFTRCKMSSHEYDHSLLYLHLPPFSSRHVVPAQASFTFTCFYVVSQPPPLYILFVHVLVHSGARIPNRGILGWNYKDCVSFICDVHLQNKV
jgi:hypothetical protein